MVSDENARLKLLWDEAYTAEKERLTKLHKEQERLAKKVKKK
jgi:hypothetical protein